MDPYMMMSTAPVLETPPVARQLSFGSVAQTDLDSQATTPNPNLGLATPLPPEEVVSLVSKSAAKKRIERLMQPKADGKFKVPEEVINEWRTGDQDRLIAEFGKAGLDKEWSTYYIWSVFYACTCLYSNKRFCKHNLDRSLSYFTHALLNVFLLQDIFVKRTMKRIREKITEKDMWVDGQFCSEADMKEMGLSEILCLMYY